MPEEMKTSPTSIDRKSTQQSIDAQTSQLSLDPFIFVPVTNDEAAKGKGLDKQVVRAHVTRIRHNKLPNFTGVNRFRNTTVTASGPYAESASRRRDRSVKTKREDSGDVTSDSGNEIAVMVPEFLADRDKPLGHRVIPSTTPASSSADPTVEIPIMKEPNEKLSLQEALKLPQGSTDAATVYTALLMSASEKGASNPDTLSRAEMLSLKSRALMEINAGLASEDRAVTDAMIGAVATMAAYEAVYGDARGFAAHIHGLKTMLAKRDGAELDGLLERLLAWIDVNVPSLTDMTRILREQVVDELSF